VSTELRRILVALDASQPSRAALESAAVLSRRLDAELIGLFIEDRALLEFAALPIARELGASSASVRGIDLVSMQRSLAAQASQARASLEHIAHRLGVRASFRVVRGNVAEELLSAALEADLLALGLSGHMGIAGKRIGSTVRAVIAGARCSILIERARRPRGDVVVLVFEGGRTGQHTLEYALDFAAARGADLVVVPVGASEVLPGLDAMLEQRRTGAVSVRIDQLQRDARALRAWVERHHCGLVMIARDSELLTEAPDLLADLGCPLLLVA